MPASPPPQPDYQPNAPAAPGTRNHPSSTSDPKHPQDRQYLIPSPRLHAIVSSPQNSPTHPPLDQFTVNPPRPPSSLGSHAHQGPSSVQSLAQQVAMNEARQFGQQLHQQQQRQQHQQLMRQGSPNTTPSLTGRMSAGGGGSTFGGQSPVLGMDVSSEPTLLLVRPTWVQDQNADGCHVCARTFNAVRRKHHCRQCGHVVCHDCSPRNIALPQLGYTKAVRVCNDCFEVAYLVAYCLSDDLGPSTQIHGVRGLYDLVTADDKKALQSVMDHGGLDAIIFLCNMVHGYEINALATTTLAALAENNTIQGVIVAKRAMPTLFHLVSVYAQHALSLTRPPSPPVALTRMASNASIHTKGVQKVETVTLVLMNITHIVFQMVPDKSIARQLAKEGAMDGLMCLCVYFPSGVRTRAMDHAIRSMARLDLNDTLEDNATLVPHLGTSDGYSQRSSLSHASVTECEEEEETPLLAMDDLFHSRLENMQGIAAKCISILTADVSNQAYIVDDPERIHRLVQLLYSTNPDVVKYASKTMAYLSLRNDRHKPDIVKGSGAAALLAVIRSACGEQHPGYQSTTTQQGASNSLSEAVSHACCALANLATNTESQEILMSQPDLLNATCAIVGLFPHQREIERHVARLIANLALYDQNKLSLLTADTGASKVPPTSPKSSSNQRRHSRQSSLAKSGGVHRYSSPPLPTRRAKANVIPTLLYIGALTLERAGLSEEDQSLDHPYYPHQGQGVIDFMNDEGQDGPFSDLDPSESGDHDMGNDDHEGEEEEEGEGDDDFQWVTKPGMKDVQRHIIRAIDNLMTSVMDDPASQQSFKVFSRVWPTLGLIKTIQMANQDEDTQRRATHVMSILIQQQEIHAEALTALEDQKKKGVLETGQGGVVATATTSDALMTEQKVREEEREQAEEARRQLEALKRVEEEKVRHEAEERQRIQSEKDAKEAEEKEERPRAKEAKDREEEGERQRIKEAKEEEERQRSKKAKQEGEEGELRRTKKVTEEEECRKAKEAKEAKKAEKIAAAAAAKAKAEAEAEERASRARFEKERLEKERLEKEKAENERLAMEKARKEQSERERLERERAEAEEAERKRLEEEEAKRKRLEEEEMEKQRIKKEWIEEQRADKERLEKERLEMEKAEEERAEMEQAEKDRLEKERAEKAQRIREQVDLRRKEKAEQEKARQEEQEEEERLEKERQEQEQLEKGRKTVTSSSSSEDQISSLDEGVKTKEKAKKKKKKSK